MTDLTFDEVVEWLKARQGATVLLELGAFEPEHDRYNAPYLTLHEVTLGLVLLGEEAHAGRPAAVVNLHDVGKWSRLVLDPSQFEGAKENHGALKVQLRGMYIGVVSSV
jgi:hypothetical protein